MERTSKAKSLQSSLAGQKLRVSRPGLHEEAFVRLRELIMSGDLLPGQQLNEIDLSDALGVSRTPLREALKLLAMENLIELRHNRSAIVTPLRPDQLTALFEAVAGLERICAELAAERMLPSDLETLEDMHDRMERLHESGDLARYFSTNNDIHTFIVACARNEPLRAGHATLFVQVKRARFLALHAIGRRDESVREHREFLDALRLRDGARAGSLIAEHVLHTGQVVTRALVDQAATDHAPGTAAGQKLFEKNPS